MKNWQAAHFEKVRSGDYRETDNVYKNCSTCRFCYNLTPDSYRYTWACAKERIPNKDEFSSLSEAEGHVCNKWKKEKDF